MNINNNSKCIWYARLSILWKFLHKYPWRCVEVARHNITFTSAYTFCSGKIIRLEHFMIITIARCRSRIHFAITTYQNYCCPSKINTLLSTPRLILKHIIATFILIVATLKRKPWEILFFVIARFCLLY